MALQKVTRDDNAETEETLKEITTPDDELNIKPSAISEDEPETFYMLAGYTDEDGVTHKSFSLREMNGRDEEAISRGDISQNMAKIVNVLLERCILNIGTLTRKSVGDEKWKNIIKDLYIGDQDYIFLKLQEISIGSEFEVAHNCPSCHTDLKTFIQFDELTVVEYKGSPFVCFELPKGYTDRKGVLHKTGKIRLPNGRDREIITPVAKRNLAVGTTLMLTRLCKFDDNTPVTEDVMSDLTVKDREYLQKLMNENQFGFDFNVPITCYNCGDEFQGTVNTANFI